MLYVHACSGEGSALLHVHSLIPLFNKSALLWTDNIPDVGCSTVGNVPEWTIIKQRNGVEVAIQNYH